ncbi:3-ketoacyl-CoA thiolase, mitochondrial [Camelus dromedarius]|uniref:LOW QUALITY PROTEIN: 3-ketoacyl-CoA thiolase, mitochondrial n=2 Tax=Camelus TaxID=9836 RepID=A0A8B8S9A5_CAMFR|nr:3-ketoacyl-CoA thiolase, mitochondrial [Camelus bactrianus]XP_010995145.1 3-ketoacyl-CoA thiolase, mitochondrial [Camelus dromedarius]XP_032326309.1 LOW QUALITY PROTEIN: 3-ketoacyl-CoA thiolase, mitochondrial [Camelus ferus]
MSLLRGVFIVAAKRTPFGAYGGLLKDFTATDLAEFAARAALSAGKVPPETVDSVIVGNVIQSSPDAIYLARHVGLRVGMAKEVPALTVNRLCGSGFQSIVSGCQDICVKDAEVVLCGGTESMSQAPFFVRNIRFGTKFGSDVKLEDSLWMSLTDQHIQTPMAITAENLAVKHKISREDCDKYALQSQQRWKAANDAGYFHNEMAPIEAKTKKGKQTMQVDEHPRPQSTLEQLNKLPPVFKKEGTVTAGNASGISDGAGAVIIASEDAVKKHNFTPLARIVGYFVSGCDPTIMGIGPVPAISGALKKTGLSLKDMDLVEVNEAFAPQYLAVEKSLDLDPSKTNVNGGAIALGHPLGGSGARITTHLVHELRRRGGRYAVGSACIGGGQGIAVIIQSTA